MNQFLLINGLYPMSYPRSQSHSFNCWSCFPIPPEGMMSLVLTVLLEGATRCGCPMRPALTP